MTNVDGVTPSIRDKDGVLIWQSRWNESRGVFGMLHVQYPMHRLDTVIGSVRFKPEDVQHVARSLRSAVELLEGLDNTDGEE